MESRQLIVVGFVLACIRLSGARFPSMNVPIYWGVDSQKPAEVEAEPGAKPEREHSRESAQQTGRLQTKQIQRALEPLPWKFPDNPVEPVNRYPLKFKHPGPVVAHNRVALRCGESEIQLEVNQDLLGLGKLIKPEEIMLGGCSATEIDDLSHVLVFKSELHGCGSTLTV